jgi:uncharacterized membrane protein YphA (DoxX/SURF4 family)
LKTTDFFTSPNIELAARIFLGSIFIYASIHKMLEPAVFAKVIYGYYLFPGFSINIIAIILPFIEFFCGLCLVAGVFPVSSAVITAGMLFSFIAAISINLARGHEFDCGCFSVAKGSHSSAVELLFRDLFYLALAIFIIIYRSNRKLCLREKI